jgi:L-rhamnose isomerase
MQMRIVRQSLAVLLAALLMAPAAQAQTHVIDRSALAQAVQERVSQDQADREAILSLLRRQEVKQIAAQAGLSLQKAEAAVSTLNGSDLRDLAAQSRQVQNDLAGGASTVTISTTTIIIVLLVVILIVLIAD